MGIFISISFILIVLALLLLPTFGNKRSRQHLTNMKQVGPFSFPLGFMWGAATSGHQVEEVDDSDWTAFEDIVVREKKFEGFGRGHAVPGHIHNFGFYTTKTRQKKSYFDIQFKNDLASAREMQLAAFRFSFSWSRLFPNARSKRPDKAALDYYQELIETILANDLQPFATLFHFTTPAWFWSKVRGKRGWERDDALRRFEDYVESVVDRFGKDIRHWCTINEPLLYAYNGYLEGVFPPHEQRQDAIDVAPVISRLLKAHAAAYRIIRKDALYRGQESHIGLAMHTRCVEPRRNYAFLDRLAAAQMERLLYWDILDSLKTGMLQLSDSNYQEEIPDLKNSADYLGLNYYGRYYLRAKLFNPGEVEMSVADDQHGVDVYPHGLYKVLTKAHRRYKLPIYLLESGIADAEHNDVERQRYMVTHLKEVWNALEAGADVRGYFHWSLLDGFEWTDGFESRFGLLAVDYQNRSKRTPRKSAEVYTQIINANAIPQSLWSKFT